MLTNDLLSQFIQWTIVMFLIQSEYSSVYYNDRVRR